MNDKEVERQRYDERAVKARMSLSAESGEHGGARNQSHEFCARHMSVTKLCLGKC